ncbi:hypothetical protein [Nocardia sp. NPDC004722]
MERETLRERLAVAAASARDFARKYVLEDLPAPLVFRVRLNQSFDGHPPASQEARFPEDSGYDRAVALRRCDFDTVVDELWRDGRVPEWVNVTAIGTTGAATLIELVCCGRFTADADRLYHRHEGNPPFHVLGPTLPPLHDGNRFSIHRRSECWDTDDLNMMIGAAEQVWALTLMTGEFDDAMLSAVPELPAVEVIEHRRCTLGNDALAAFSRFPQLRHLRLYLSDGDDFHLGGGAHLDALTHLQISNLPNHPWGQAVLSDAAPRITALNLSGRDAIRLDGPLSATLRDLQLSATRVAGPGRLPHRLENLGIHLSGGTDQLVAALLHDITVNTLSLRDTPVTDAILPTLERHDLTSIDFVGTQVTPVALADFHARHPGTRLQPPPPE